MTAKNRGNTVTKTVHYKIARFASDSHNLQSLLRASLDVFPTVGERSQITGIADDGKRRVISHDFHKGMLCGWLVDYTPGNSAPGMVVDENATSLKIESVVPQAKGGKQREYAEGILYFGVQDNHVLVTQSTGLLTSHFERYLNWIIRDKAAKLKPENYVMIADQLTNPLKQQRGISGVKAIRVSDRLMSLLRFRHQGI